MIIQGLNEASQKIHEANKGKGFYDKPREIGTLLMLVVSELSEALEADRKYRHADLYTFEKMINDAIIQNKKFANGEMPVKFKENNDIEYLKKITFEISIKDSFEDEIADAMIRLLDLCGYLNIDIEKHIGLKLSYNENRPHKHGKNY